MIRGLPAIVWYGFQTWLGGSAINQISIAIFGYDNVVLFFLLFQVVQIVCVTQYWGVIGDKLISRKGSWGMPFIAAIIAFFGNSTTVMLNAGDYSRELKGGFSVGKRGVAYFIAMVPTTVLLGLIGAMASTATGIANPINAFSQMVHNKVLLVATLGFILFAQMTNDSSAAGLDLFVKIYTAFFGPIFAVLITDYYILHRGKMEGAALDDLYDDNGTHSGINWAAIIATAVGAVIGLVNVDISFFTATIPTGLVYYFCMKHMPSCQRFRKGTSLEK